MLPAQCPACGCCKDPSSYSQKLGASRGLCGKEGKAVLWVSRPPRPEWGHMKRGLARSSERVSE